MFMSNGCRVQVVNRIRAIEVGQHLVDRYEYSDFRLHKIFSKDEVRRIHFESFIGDDKRTDHFFIVEGVGGAIGLLKLSQLDWDSLHFGQSMHRIGFLHCEKDSLAWEALGGSVLKMLTSFIGGGYVDAIVDHDDYIWLNSLLDAGFRLYDSKNSYVFRSHQKPVDFHAPFVCRDFFIDDMGAVLDVLKGVNFPARFSRDPFFNSRKKKVEKMYESWVRGLMSRKNVDGPALVVERNKRVVAFGAGAKLLLPSAANGKKVCGNSLFFCSADAPGSYPALVHYLTRNTKNYFDALELSASITNYPAVRVLGRLGLQVAGGKHSLSINLSDRS